MTWLKTTAKESELSIISKHTSKKIPNEKNIKKGNFGLIACWRRKKYARKKTQVQF